MTVDTQWSVIAWGQIEGSRDHGAHMRVPQETWIGRGGKERKRGLERRGWKGKKKGVGKEREKRKKKKKRRN